LFNVLLFIDAPFGRFTPEKNSIFLVDGIKAWIVMELVSPISFLYTYAHSPLSKLSFGFPPPLALSNPANLLTSLFLIHYFNRALVSPLRTPSRSKSHLIVPLFAVFFNIINGTLMAAYLSSPSAIEFLSAAYSRPTFWIGVVVWAAGFVGNIIHDEILFNIRRKANAKGQSKDKYNSSQKEHYSIPHGLLYEYISYPNYFCEWIEWLGFALASSPLPDFSSGSAFLATASPSFLFFIAEICLMAPRAFKGHLWYKSRFPDYPKRRKAVIPFMF